MEDHRQSTNGFIGMIFLAIIMLAFLSGCGKSREEILSEEVRRLNSNIEVLEERNNELESEVKISNNEVQVLEKQTEKQKSDLKNEYEVQFKNEITKSIRDEYRWTAVKNASIILLVMSMPLFFLYYENIKKSKQLKKDAIDLINELKIHKDDLDSRYSEKVSENKAILDGYQRRLDMLLSKENQITGGRRSEKEEKIRLSNRILDIQDILNQSRTKIVG